MNTDKLMISRNIHKSTCYQLYNRKLLLFIYYFILIYIDERISI